MTGFYATAILERAAVNDKISNLEKSRDMWRYMYAEVKKDSVNKDKMIAEKDKIIAEKDWITAEKDWITAERDETIIKLKADITHLERRHENPHMSSSTDTDYNEKRRKYRKVRGEDTNGSPGDKATTDGYSIGPPLGHTGVSHSNTPSCTLKYNLGTDRCYICGHKMKRQAPIRKMITDMDRYMRPVSAMAVIQNACCTHCGATVKARTPFLAAVLSAVG